MFRTPYLLAHSLNTVLPAPSQLQIMYIYIYIHLLNSEVALRWDSKHFKVIFQMSLVQISAQRSLLLTKLQIFFTPCGKCQDTGIVRNCNVTDSFHILSSSFFTNHRTARCYTLCCSLPRYINHKQNKATKHHNYVSRLHGLLHFNIIRSNAQSSYS